MREVRLVQVTTDNNNKFYNMKEEGSQLVAEYGRIGVTCQKKIYPLGRWGRIYNSKLRKGYKDVTDLFIEKETSKEFVDVEDSVIQEIVSRLQRLAQMSIEEHYTVSANAVTQNQVDAAQKLVDELAAEAKSKNNVHSFNSVLLELFQTIPRKMRKVQDEVLEGTVMDKRILKMARKMVADEQSLLDTMAGQVRMDIEPRTNDQNILDAVGMEITQASTDETDMVRSQMSDSANQFKRAFAINHYKSHQIFKEYVDAQVNKETKFLWHGSRNENWWNILDSGLLIRPANAVYTGSMLGNGIYFADRARKSIGYTSTDGSYWASGRDPFGFLALYDVHIGNPLIIDTAHENWHGDLDLKRLQQKGDYHCLFAKKGKRDRWGSSGLYNNEWVVYDTRQSTVKFLVEIKAA
jgi:poly [ADP-ribose] polymerase 2/3/4